MSRFIVEAGSGASLMVPTFRLIQFIVLGSPLWLLGLAFPAGWVAGASYLFILGLLYVREYYSLPEAASFEVERRFGRLALGTTADIQVTFRNHSKRYLNMSLRDELPAGLQEVGDFPIARIGAKAECELSYQVRPVRRGRYR